MPIDRSNACDQMLGVLLAMPEESRANRSDICEALYDAGYRKFEIVDEPPAPADGGPAFGDRAIKQGGLTIRDYFAASALQGMMANEAAVQRYATQSQAEGFEPITLMTTMAYYAADTMLQERAK